MTPPSTLPAHTPGPWQLETDTQGVYTVTRSPGILIARVGSGIDAFCEQEEANARLIAAAPLLLEALEAAHGSLMEVFYGITTKEARALIEGALAVAKGT